MERRFIVWFGHRKFPLGSENCTVGETLERQAASPPWMKRMLVSLGYKNQMEDFKNGMWHEYAIGGTVWISL